MTTRKRRENLDRRRIYFSADPDDWMEFGFGAEIMTITVETNQGTYQLVPYIDHKGIERECDPKWTARKVAR